MLGAIKAIPEMIKNWRDNRDLLYQLVTGPSAALVGVGVATGTRPSDSLAELARGLAATSVADWFSAKAPPVLAVSVPLVQSVALSAAFTLLAGMVVVPLWRRRHDDNQMFGYGPLRLLGSPSAGTVWVLLLIAAQNGDIAPVLRQWANTAFSVGVWTIGALAAAGVMYLVGSHYRFGNLMRLPFWPATFLVYRIGFGVCATLFAVVLAAISLPLSVLSWMTGLESDHSRKVCYEVERERAEHAARPVGAAVAPI